MVKPTKHKLDLAYIEAIALTKYKFKIKGKGLNNKKPKAINL